MDMLALAPCILGTAYRVFITQYAVGAGERQPRLAERRRAAAGLGTARLARAQARGAEIMNAISKQNQAKSA
jgi:hypothetical protein